MALHYRPLSGRRRLLIVLLSIATATTIVLALVAPPGAVKRTPRPHPSAPVAGGKVDVIVVPASSAASQTSR